MLLVVVLSLFLCNNISLFVPFILGLIIYNLSIYKRSYYFDLVLYLSGVMILQNFKYPGTRVMIHDFFYFT